MKTTLTDRLLIAGLLATVFLYCLTPVHNGNIFWHLRNGEDILETLSIRTQDPFTHTEHGSTWVQQEWLAEVSFALAWKYTGEAGLIFLKALLVTAAVFLTVMAARRKGASVPVTILVAIAWFSVCHARWIVRPHVFTILYFSLYLFLLSGKQRSLLQSLLLFLPLQVLWVNTHAGFVMGPFLLFLPVLDRCRKNAWMEAAKKLILPFSAQLVSGIHPNGYRSLEYLPSFLSQPLFRETIREWWSPFDPRYQPEQAISRTALLLLVMLAATIVLVFVFRKRASLSGIVGVALLSVASLFAARNIELLSLAAIAWISPIIRGRVRVWIPAGVLTCAAVLPFVLGVPREVGPPRQIGLHVDWDIYPVEFADFMDEHPALLESTVFNTNEISGYLEYRFGEDLLLYMDGRCLLYPESFYEEYLLLAKADSTHALGQLRTIQHRGIDLAIFDWPDEGRSSAWLLSRLPGWAPLFWDDLTVVYVRIDHLDSLGLSELAMTNIDPLDMAGVLSYPLYRIPPSWLPELERAASPPLNLGIASVLRIAVNLQHGDLDEADRLARELRHEHLRASMLLALNGESPGSGSPQQLITIQVWSLVRQDRLEEALAAADVLDDPILLGSISLWSEYRNGSMTTESVYPSLLFPSEVLLQGLRNGFDTPEGILILASAALVCGMGDEAEDLLALSLEEMDSLHPWALGAAGIISALTGNDSIAVVLADKAMSMAVTPFTLESRGRIDWMAGRYESAAGYFDILMRMSPGYGGARILYADCLWRMRDVDGAYEQYLLLSGSGQPQPPEVLARMQLMEVLLSD